MYLFSSLFVEMQCDFGAILLEELIFLSSGSEKPFLLTSLLDPDGSTSFDVKE